MRSPARIVVAAALAGGAAVAVPAGPAHGLSCVDPPTVLRDAPQVYAGTVERVEDERFLFAVDEVWAGDPVAQRVWLTTPADLAFWYPWRNTQHAQAHEPGSPRQWVVAPDEAGTVGPCSLWPTDTVLTHRPGTVQEPTPITSPHVEDVHAASAGPAPEVIGSAAGVVAVGVAAVGGLWRHRRRDDQPR